MILRWASGENRLELIALYSCSTNFHPVEIPDLYVMILTGLLGRTVLELIELYNIQYKESQFSSGFHLRKH